MIGLTPDITHATVPQFFFVKQKTAYEIMPRLVGSEMCIRDRHEVASAFGVQDQLRIHARTAGENKTLYDPYVNMLRVTTEAVSAVLGGCDSLTITPCGFDAHLAENVHHILREESHLDKVIDPGAGSYYVEALTDAPVSYTHLRAHE